MELVELTEEEFKGFAYHHEQASFLQTLGWAKLKHDTGWDYEYVYGDFDELYIERNGAGRYWIHFAVRPKDNRRKTRFIQT